MEIQGNLRGNRESKMYKWKECQMELYKELLSWSFSKAPELQNERKSFHLENYFAPPFPPRLLLKLDVQVQNR